MNGYSAFSRSLWRLRKIGLEDSRRSTGPPLTRMRFGRIIASPDNWAPTIASRLATVAHGTPWWPHPPQRLGRYVTLRRDHGSSDFVRTPQLSRCP